MTLKEWVGQKRRTMEAAVMVEALAELLAHLHGSGRVHRDIKPDNLLYLLRSTAWRILDFGIVSAPGAPALCLSKHSQEHSCVHGKPAMLAPILALSPLSPQVNQCPVDTKSRGEVASPGQTVTSMLQA